MSYMHHYTTERNHEEMSVAVGSRTLAVATRKWWQLRWRITTPGRSEYFWVEQFTFRSQPAAREFLERLADLHEGKLPMFQHCTWEGE